MSILVIGATGLLGNAVFRVLHESSSVPVYGTTRKEKAKEYFLSELSNNLFVVNDIMLENELSDLLNRISPKVIVNCASFDKETSNDPLKMINTLSIFPKRLSHLCRSHEARLIQISSDGVFSGRKGNYTENDLPDAYDIYGIAKWLGEVSCKNEITLRTSIIGHELYSQNGLLEWFLSQEGGCVGYKNVIFSGFPTVVLANIIRDFVLPHTELCGVYHLASSPITKFDLLQMIASQYNKPIKIVPDEQLVINRSLSSEKFSKETGYVAPPWPELIDMMRSYKFGLRKPNV